MSPDANGSQPKHDEWVVVVQYSGVQADMDADYALSVLGGSSIPAVRLPVGSAILIGDGAALRPVRVLVPPDRADEARELLE